jgi:FkbM family methyltransferase
VVGAASAVVQRAASIPRNVVRESLEAHQRAADVRSSLRYAGDTVLYRGLYFGRASRRERTIRLGEGVKLTYRLNRGDIQAIREVWVEECYRPPVEIPIDTVVDLGANIGLTSVWYAAHYGASRLLCVEPVPQNAALARRNLAQNGIEADFVEAAVGPVDGTARFTEDPNYSTRGHLSPSGTTSVPMVSVPTLLGRLEGQSVDLLKMDIEGAEDPVLRRDPGWLERVNALFIEFDHGDPATLSQILKARGFRYIPAGSVSWCWTDFFVRDRAVRARATVRPAA